MTTRPSRSRGRPTARSWLPAGRRSEGRAPTSAGRTRTSLSPATSANEQSAGRSGIVRESTERLGGQVPPRVASPLVVYEPVEVVFRGGRGARAIGERGAAAAGAGDSCRPCHLREVLSKTSARRSRV